MTTPAFDEGIQNLTNAEILQIMIDVVKLLHSRIRPPSMPLVMSEMLLEVLVRHVYSDLAKIKRTGEAEKSMLDGVEDLKTADGIPSNPDGDWADLITILEKLHINIRKRFSENRMWYYL